MKRVFKFLVPVILLCGFRASEAPAPASQPANQFLLGGIQINEPDHQEWVEALQSDGMNTVSVTVYAKQGDWETDNLWWEEEEAAVVSEIRTAKASGLKVVLILRVALDHAFVRNEFYWHGMILPKTNPLIDAWFERYTRFTLKWAKIAQQEGVDVFAIGSEMNALSSTLPTEEIPDLYAYYLNRDKQANYRKRVMRHKQVLTERNLWTPGPNKHSTLESFIDARISANRFWAKQHSFAGDANRLEKINARRKRINNHWVSLIRKTRQHYRGPLTYAANFDNYHQVGFWKELDFMGINAYFQLRTWKGEKDRSEVSFVRFKERWEEIFAQIGRFKRKQSLSDKPVIFTELGYTYRKNCSIEPWSSYGFSLIGPTREELIIWQDQPIDYSERELAVKALHAVTSKLGPDNFRGILYWKLSSKEYHKDIEPFMLHIGQESDDPLKLALRRFTQ